MSTVIAWATNEGRGQIGSFYMASDSRISWGKTILWDSGQKVFALKEDGIISYVGDVLFPTQILSQLTTLINQEVIYKKTNTNQEKITLIYKYLQPYMQKYPLQLNETKIVVCLVNNKQFNLYEIDQTGYKEIDIEAGKVYSYGSGSSEYQKSLSKVGFQDNTSKEIISVEQSYSRYIFQALVHALNKDSSDPISGGNIQLVGLYKYGKSSPFGIIYQEKKFLLGLEVADDLDLSQYEWRNENFEVSSYVSMQRKENQQRQPFLKELKS